MLFSQLLFQQYHQANKPFGHQLRQEPQQLKHQRLQHQQNQKQQHQLIQQHCQ